ncbi:SH3 domain-containing protein [Sporolactobacillus sp. STSJ-5]|uniref:GH25 family lysozyme n=1 Tax=Sporolactobacillus sp. STSJ-5 TaxID=2965076 RepID=UPI0021051F22|nr:SH3 domain-containing protein [Sporolactobacillus sp. STSJ-5]
MNKTVKMLSVALIFFSLTIGSMIAPFEQSAHAAAANYKAYVRCYSLNIRNKPSSKYKTVRTVHMNTRITVLVQKKGYAYIYSGGKRGYVQNKWLKGKIDSKRAHITVTAVNARSGAGNQYKSVKKLKHNEKITVSGYHGGWYGFKHGRVTYYIAAKYVKMGNPPIASAASPEVVKLNYSPINAYTAYIGYDNLKIYQDTNTKSAVVATLREKTAVNIIGQNGDWIRIRTNDGKEGFVYKDNVTTDLNRFNPPAGANGVDLSHWQNDRSGGTIDFNAIKNAGNSFVIVKASEGSNGSDNTFSANAHQAQNVGLKVDAYHFFRAATSDQAIAEANNFANVLNNSGFTNDNLGYLFVDVETTNGIEGNVKETISDNVNVFLNQMRNRGFSKLGIYSGANFYKTYIDMSRISQPQRMLIWIARYRGQDTNNGVETGFQVDIWQYTSNGTVSGVNGAVDQNVSYYDPNAM